MHGHHIATCICDGWVIATKLMNLHNIWLAVSCMIGEVGQINKATILYIQTSVYAPQWFLNAN